MRASGREEEGWRVVVAKYDHATTHKVLPILVDGIKPKREKRIYM